MRHIFPLFILCMSCNSSDGSEAPVSEAEPAVGGEMPEETVEEPTPVECGTAQQSDSVEVLDPPFLTAGKLVIYTVEGPSGPNRSFAICAGTEDALSFSAFPQRMGAAGLTLDDAEKRIAYATLALRVRFDDQITLIDSSDALAGSLRAGEERIGEELRARYRTEITPPRSEGDAPWTIGFWGVSGDLSQLEVVVTADGGVTITDAVRESELPVPMRI